MDPKSPRPSDSESSRKPQTPPAERTDTANASTRNQPVARTGATEPEPESKASTDSTDNVVDEASIESFPASDPPAWSGHPHPTPDEEPDS